MSGPLDASYVQRLRIALRQTEMTREVVNRVGKRNAFVRQEFSDFSESEKGGAKDKLLWRTEEDSVRQDRLRKYGDIHANDSEKHLRPDWLPSGKVEYKRYNLARFITTTYADIMCGGGVEIKTGNDVADDYISQEAPISDYFYKWQKYVSIYGFIGLQVVQDKDGVDIIKVMPDILYVQWKDGSDDDYEWIAKKTRIDPAEVKDPGGSWDFEDQSKRSDIDGVVFEERHYRGRIEYYLYAVKEDEIVQMLPPQWYDKDLPPLDEQGKSFVGTNINEFMLFIIPNIVFNRSFVSDYEDILDQMASINVRMTQIARVLNIHADPKLMLPESYRAKDPYTGEIVVRAARDEVLFISPEDADNKPEYLTWSSQLEHAYAEIEQDINAVCTVAKISPSLLVKRELNFPESAVAYKLRLTPTINHVARKRVDFKTALQRVLWVFLQKLEKTGAFRTPEADIQEVDQDSGFNARSMDHKDSTIDSVCLIKSPKQIQIRFIPALPQDERLAVERATNDPPTYSLERLLVDVDGMSEDEARKEMAKIRVYAQMKDEMTASSEGFGFGGDTFDGMGQPGNPQSSAINDGEF